MAALLRLIKKKPEKVAGSDVFVKSFPNGEEEFCVDQGGLDKRTCKQKAKSDQAASSKGKKGGKGKFTNNSQGLRRRRLMKEFAQISKTIQDNCEWFSAELVEDNLYEWNIMLFSVDSGSELHKDMKDFGIPHILLNLSFPENFPFSPPFMRVVKPRIRGGFVLDGGAICMELLTPSGWSSAYTVEAIIMQFSALIVKGRGRIDEKSKSGFNKKVAEAAFKKLVKTHEMYGWITPPMSEG